MISSTSFELRDEFYESLKEIICGTPHPIFITTTSAKQDHSTGVIIFSTPKEKQDIDSLILTTLKSREVNDEVWQVYTLDEVDAGKAPFGVDFKKGTVDFPSLPALTQLTLNHNVNAGMFDKKGKPKNKPWYQKFDKTKQRY